ncbi:YceI family protein [Microbacter margulisiae]|uniref:Polyisoprenoid-binding protein YceI n=1 Tax=Microbacter margulisiae TaxID=1350067 RepID=A0A7W5DRN8_9PORP|nr:YceI family protein [Microbacter margulisiae]MBB3187493.1 polyisoprenoid-binding protein YceI [Microbacter margulisiae]
MNTKNKLVLFAIVLFTMSFSVAHAEDTYDIVPSMSSMEVLGTSTLHNWHMNASNIISTAKVVNNTQIVSSLFKVEVNSLKSSEGTMMDNIAHKSLKMKNYPEIIFSIQSAKVNSTNKTGFEGTVTGNLMIAGVTRAVAIPVNVTYLVNNMIKVAGSIPLTMTEFGIKPPTAMLGMVKSGDQIRVAFVLIFKKQ